MGVILFECLIGYRPFHLSHNALQICRKIVYYRRFFKLPSDAKLSREALDLICNLIASHRRRYSFQQINTHSWFEVLDWNNLIDMEPPFNIPITTSVHQMDALVYGYFRMMEKTLLENAVVIPLEILAIVLQYFKSSLEYKESEKYEICEREVKKPLIEKKQDTDK